MTLHISRDGTLWAGGFYNGLNSLNLNLLNFNFETNQTNSINCAQNPRILSIEKDVDHSLWLGNSDGLIHWQPRTKKCQLINHNNIYNNGLQPFSVYGTSIESLQVWIASSIGLLRYDKTLQQITSHNHGITQTPVFFVQQLKNNQLLLGTSRGLYLYDSIRSSYHKIETPKNVPKQISFTKYSADKSGQIYLPTNHGLFLLSSDKQLRRFTTEHGLFTNKAIETVTTNQQGELFISVSGLGLYHLDQNHQLVHHYFQDIKQHNILQVITHGNWLWMSSDHGIIAVNTDSKKISFYSSEVYENHLALTKTSYKDKANHFYFGGNSGMIHFDPHTIDTDIHSYPLIFKNLLLMDNPVALNKQTNTGFTLTTPINQTKKMRFSHNDKMIGLSFIQANYHNPRNTQYRYKLSPIFSQWSSLNGRNPQLTFSNLKSGNYQLNIEATNFNTKRYKSINFRINRSPWLSWWAFVIYSASLMTVIYFYIIRRIANEKKISRYLKDQVTQQTSHIEQQKQTVEDLMARKNEIFSNVSHEFRTPITLILGPMEELLKREKDASKKQHFAMVTRNAKRLLNLVNHMLKLAQVNETDTAEKQRINLSSRLSMICEPFSHLAKINHINLHIQTFDNIQLMLTEDTLEIIMTNLLSNAIKYTEADGEISIGTRLTKHHVEVYVKDNGKGIADKDHKKIFKRFERLNDDSTHGVGIGLAVVKELVELNQAELLLNSALDQGSEFIVKFPIDLSLQDKNYLQKNTTLSNVSHIETSILSTKQTVLIIDDNQDMRLYLQQVLSEYFNCLLASSPNISS